MSWDRKEAVKMEIIFAILFVIGCVVFSGVLLTLNGNDKIDSIMAAVAAILILALLWGGGLSYLLSLLGG